MYVYVVYRSIHIHIHTGAREEHRGSRLVTLFFLLSTETGARPAVGTPRGPLVSASHSTAVTAIHAQFLQGCLGLELRSLCLSSKSPHLLVLLPDPWTHSLAFFCSWHTCVHIQMNKETHIHTHQSLPPLHTLMQTPSCSE